MAMKARPRFISSDRVDEGRRSSLEDHRRQLDKLFDEVQADHIFPTGDRSTLTEPYSFTASTPFANPVVTVASAMSN